MSQQRVNPVLKIDPEFESRIPPLTEEEFKQLEENILAEGTILMPLIVWGDTIVDGHNRYKIAQAHPQIIYTAYEKDFDSRYEALSWICKNQLGRRNLTPIQKRVLVGEQYEAEKMIDGFRGNQHTSSAESGGGKKCPHHQKDRHHTRKRVANESGVTEAYVKCAGQYSKGINAAEEMSPGFRQEVLSGNIKPTQKEMQTVAQGSPEEQRSIIDQVFRRGRKSSNAMRGKTRKKLPDVTLNTTADGEEHTVTAASAVRQFEWEVTRVMQDFDITFDQWPQLINEEQYRTQVIATLQDLKKYISHIEGGTRYEWDYESRKIAL